VSAKRCPLARLDQDHGARDRRIEEATAEVLLQVEERMAAQEAVQAASVGIGAALRRLRDDEAIAGGRRAAGRADGQRGAPACLGAADRVAGVERSRGRRLRRRYSREAVTGTALAAGG